MSLHNRGTRKAKRRSRPGRGYSPISVKTDIDPAVFDAASMAAVVNLLPPERLHGYLVELDRQLRLVVDAAAGDPFLESRAHKIVSQAGMLGLTRMSESARALEDACRSGTATEPALRQCRAAIGDIQLYAMPAAGFPQAPATAANS